MVAQHGAIGLRRLRVGISLRSWPRILFLILGLVSIGLALSFFVGSLSHPYVGVEGVLEEGRWVIGTVDRSGLAHEAGIEPGDAIVAINGQPMEQFSQGLTFISARAIDELTVVNSAGELQSVTTAGSRLPSSAVTESISFFAISVAFWLAGLFVLLRKPDVRLARLLCLLCFAIAVAVVAPLVGVRDILWGPHIEIASYLLLSPLFLHFSLLFPRDQEPSGYSRYLPAALYVLSAIIMLCYASFGYRAAILYPWFRIVILADLLLGLALGVIALGRNYFGTDFVRARQQIKIVTAGTVIGVLPFIGLSLLPDIIGQRLLVAPQLTILGVILVPLALAYAVVRYKLLDIDLIIGRGLLYGVLAVAILLGYALLGLILAMFLQSSSWLVNTVIIVAFSCIMILLFAPLKTRLQYFVDRRIFRDRYDYKHTLRMLTSTISSVTDLGTLSWYLVDSVSRNLGLSGACLLLRDEAGNLVPAAASGEYEQVAVQGHLANYAKTLEEENRFPNQAPAESRASFFVFLTTNERELGVLCLGPKVSRVPFTVDDISFIVTLSHPVALAIQNALLVADAEARERQLSETRQELKVSTQSLKDREKERDELYLSVAKTLIAVLENRDPYTRGHSERVAQLCRNTGAELGLEPKELHMIELAAHFHDIGKVGMADSIFFKAGPLSPSEQSEMRLHPTRSAEILRFLHFLEDTLPAIEYHHERYDGTGYPRGLQGDAIPLAARILAVADSYDAMTSTRPYRPARTDAEAINELRQGAGSQWDATVVDAFVRALGW